MPSNEHELIVELFRDGELVRVLLGRAGVNVKKKAARVADATLTTPEIRADLVAVFGEGKSRLAVVIEVQRNRDAKKKWAWPLYQAAARARHECEACVLVFATDNRVAAWARAPIRLGPTSSFRALVIGRRDVPAITDESRARALPQLAILSAFARARDDDALEVSRAAMSALDTMHRDRARVYYDLILATLDKPAAQALEEWMDLKNYVFKSDFAKRHFAEGEAKGKAEGVAEGKAEGEAKGKAEGEAKGKAEGAREALYDVLGARRFEVDESVRARIDACGDVSTLRSWITRAAVADSISEIFG